MYPAILKRSTRMGCNSEHERDAYTMACWLKNCDILDEWEKYCDPKRFKPPLTSQEQQIAKREGWILGVI